MMKTENLRGIRTFRAAQVSFLAFIVSLVFMQPSAAIGGPKVIPGDLLFVLTFALWTVALVRGETGFQWLNFYWLLMLYFASLTLSALLSPDLGTSFVKLAGEAYLLSIPVLTLNLVQEERDLRTAAAAWLLGTAILIPVALCSLILYYLHPHHPLLDYMLFGFGSLPEGPYPRLRLTFENANMLCHYLSISLMLVLIGREVGELSQNVFRFLLAAILIMSLLTISPGLGGVGLCLGLWFWWLWRETKIARARLALWTGAGAAFAFLLAAMVAPQIHATAPFMIKLPFVDTVVTPSGRIMTWMGALQTFLAHPVSGKGLGLGATSVFYLAPVGGMQHLTDAHNLFLNVAAEAGLPALIAILLIALWLIRASLPSKSAFPRLASIKTGLGIAFLGSFVYQGLAGSFEDARHLWVLVGFILVSHRLGKAETPPPPKAS